MKQYLLDFFNYNDGANKALLTSIKQLPEKDESIKLFSHFITTQNKWLNRITKETEDGQHHWFGTIFPMEALESEWTRSINSWIAIIENSQESELEVLVKFKSQANGKEYGISLKDLVLQLNYHCIHHRAQINTLISKQGLKPPATDYIFTKLKELPV